MSEEQFEVQTVAPHFNFPATKDAVCKEKVVFILINEIENLKQMLQ